MSKYQIVFYNNDVNKTPIEFDNRMSLLYKYNINLAEKHNKKKIYNLYSKFIRKNNTINSEEYSKYIMRLGILKYEYEIKMQNDIRNIQQYILNECIRYLQSNKHILFQKSLILDNMTYEYFYTILIINNKLSVNKMVEYINNSNEI